MANHSLEITLTGNERPDGSIYLFSEGLPGFHFILAAGEDPQEVVKPALMKFLGFYLPAVIKNTMPTLRLEQRDAAKRRKFMAELQFA